MATFRTTSISADKRPSKRISLSSLASLASIDSGCSSLESKPIVVTTTISTTTATYPMTVPPPFATSLGSDERLPRPRRGAPPVTPVKNAVERRERQESKLVQTLRRAMGLETTQLDPALCEGWCISHSHSHVSVIACLYVIAVSMLSLARNVTIMGLKRKRRSLQSE
ncbi:hypothetical protein C8R45DRAFT_931417 [Mycena sanguinolenta]|nr:hypothetical protein C8R45DRAFT_931417 [Mycena sanguinolenta]